MPALPPELTSRSPRQPLPLLARFLRSACLAGTIGGSLGLAISGLWLFAKLDAFIRQNVLSASDRHLSLSLIGMGFMIGVTVFSLVWSHVGPDLAERGVRLMGPMAVVGVVPLLCSHKFWVNNELTFLVLVLACAAALRVLLENALVVDGSSPIVMWESYRLGFSKLGRRLPIGLVIAAAIAYAAYFSVLTLRMHYNFCTSAFDLGIEDNLVWNAVHWEALFRSTPLGGSMRHGGFHQTYFAYVVGLVYRLAPRAETLLIFQSAMIGAAMIPLFLFARRRIGEWAALFVVLLFPFYAPLHGANLYDFHYQPLGMFFILLVAYLVESRRDRWIIPAVLLTLSVREDMGAMLAALGAFFAFTGRRTQLGLVLTAVGGTYFVLLKLYIMPHFFLSGESSFAFMYKDLLPAGEQGFGGVLKSAFGNPAYTLSTLLLREKLLYLLQIFVPFCLFPLRRSAALVLFGPAAIFTLLSTAYPALISTTFQYTSYWTPMLFLAAVFGLESLRREAVSEDVAESVVRVDKARTAAWIGAMAFAMLFTSIRFGAIFQHETAIGAFDPVRLDITPSDVKNHDDFTRLAAQIPPKAPVAAAEWLIPHVSNRRDAYAIRNGIVDAQYVIFWLHPTKLRADERPILRGLLRPGGSFGIVEQRGLFVLAKRGYSPAKNASILARL